LHWPGPAPAGGLLSCVAKKVGKEGDPASPVVGFADDCLALLGGSEGAFTQHRAFAETACVINELNKPFFCSKWIPASSCLIVERRVTLR